MSVQISVGSLYLACGKLCVDEDKGRLWLDLRGVNSREASQIVRTLLVIGAGCRFDLKLKE